MGITFLLPTRDTRTTLVQAHDGKGPIGQPQGKGELLIMPRRTLIKAVAVIVTTIVTASAASAVQIVQSRGADPRVDYPSLSRYGLWDDRNYTLRQEDLSLIGAGEEDLQILIPLFFRVELHERIPGLPQTGPFRYPRSALQYFRGHYGGYLIDGKLYRNAVLQDGKLRVDLDEGVDQETFSA